MKKVRKISLILMAIATLVFINACEDAPPTEYIPETYVEFYLFVGEPIHQLRLFTTQPTNEPYIAAKAAVRDAKVVIKANGKEFKMLYKDTLDYGYYYPDTTYLVQPNTTYDLTITLNDGKIITGSTTTPENISWKKQPKDYVQFPLDTLDPQPDSSNIISWTQVQGNYLYIVNVLCLDTLEYGKYLDPPTGEINRRTYKFFGRNSERPYRELSNTNMVASTKTPTVWMAFKWFGRHRASVLAPDYNYMKWFINAFYSQYHDPLMNSVTNAIGVFGSASVARKEFFLLKNQP